MQPVSSVRTEQRLLTARAELDGLTVAFLGTPASGSKQVTIQLKRFGSSTEIANCQMLDLDLDGQQLHFPMRGRGQSRGPVVAETAQVSVTIEIIQSLQAAKQSTLSLCGVERELNLEVRAALDEFVREFSARAPAGHVQAL